MNGMGYFDYEIKRNRAPKRYASTSGECATVSFLYDGHGNRKYLTVAERTAFLEAAQGLPSDVRSLCRTLSYTGARISEVLSLTPERIDFAAGLIIIESLKKRRRGIFRAVPIPSAVLAELDSVHSVRVAQRDPELARQKLWPWCRTTAWARVKECMANAEINGPQASPKGLRHAFAIAALQAGVPINFVKKWLGHARLSTTEIYADAVGDEESSIAARFWKTF